MSELLILRDHIDWGTYRGCFTSENQKVPFGSNAPDAVFDRWRPNRNLTQADTNEITRRKGRVEGLLNKWLSKTNEAKEQWAWLAQKTNDNWSSCDKGPSCFFKKQTEINPEFTKGRELLFESSAQRRGCYRELDFLMVNAPEKETAQAICRKKVEATEKSDKILDDIGKYMTQINEKNDEAHRKQDSFYAGLLALFEALKSIILALIEIIKAGFQLIIDQAQNVAKLAGFFAKNPWMIAVLGGTLAVGILAFVMRPYVAIFFRG